MSLMRPMELQPISVPAGRTIPFHSSPSGGTTLGESSIAGGNHRSVSLIVAERYGKACAVSLLTTLSLGMGPTESISACNVRSTRGFVETRSMAVRIVVADESDPASLIPTGRRRIEGMWWEFITYTWSRISPSASSWVKPRATKDPNMSFCTFLFGPNRSAAVCLAILSDDGLARVADEEVKEGRQNTNLPHQLADTDFVAVLGPNPIQGRPVKHLDKPRVVCEHPHDGKMFFNDPEVVVDVRVRSQEAKWLPVGEMAQHIGRQVLGFTAKVECFVMGYVA